MKLAIYNENCVMAGRGVTQGTLDSNDDPDNGGDWTWHEGSPEELLADADSLDQPGTSPYLRRVAETIREAVYWERPDLKPAEVAGDED